jgi:hypothetical protein
MGSGIAVKQSADVVRHRVSKYKKNRKRAMMGKSLMLKIRLSEHMLVDGHPDYNSRLAGYQPAMHNGSLTTTTGCMP